MFAIRSTLATLAVVSLVSTGTALAQGAGPEGGNHMRLAANTPSTYATAILGSQATGTRLDNSGATANAAKRSNPTVSWSLTPPANLYAGGQ